MKEVRCPNCRKLLGKFKGKGEVKCNRCKEIVNFNTEQDTKQSVD